mgnify:CR=1 FL=1
MILDNILVNSIKKEFKQKLIGNRIERINQVDNYNFLFETWNKKSNDFIISLHPNTYRACITNNKYKYVKIPAPFCSQMKKFLEGSYILNVEQINFDRILKITFEGIDNVRDKVIYFMFIELTGKYSNLIVTNQNESVLCAYRYINEERNEERQILIEKPYASITNKLNKIDFNDLNELVFDKSFLSNQEIKTDKFLTKCFLGISTHTANLILEENLKNRLVLSLDQNEKETLFKTVFNFYKALKDDDLFIDFFTKDKKLDFFISKEENYNVSEIIEEHFYDINKDNALKFLKTELEIFSTKNITKLKNKLEDTNTTLKSAENYEVYKQFSDLIYSNIYNLPAKAKIIELENYYDNNNLISIELDDQIDLNENAQKFLKKYNKLKNTITAVNRIINNIENELLYFENILVFLNNAESVDDLNDIKTELEEQNYLPPRKEKGKKKKNDKPNFLTFKSQDGFDIFIGKNSNQNDFLTTKFSGSNDIWFHTRLIAGSHVIVRTDNGQKNITENTIIEAAKLAVKYSKAKDSSNVCVIYTKIKNVKKIPHSKPGFVNYSNEKAVYVTP